MDLELLRQFMIRQTEAPGHNHVNSIFQDIKKDSDRAACEALMALADMRDVCKRAGRPPPQLADVLTGFIMGITCASGSEGPTFKTVLSGYLDHAKKVHGENVVDFTAERFKFRKQDA